MIQICSDFSDSNIRAEGVALLADALRVNTRLETLSVKGNFICTTQTRSGQGEEDHTTHGVAALADALRLNQTLKTLNLNHNDLRSDGAKVIGECLLDNGSLRTLAMQVNSIGTDGAEALASSLAGNSSLRLLDLRSNDRLGRKVADSFLAVSRQRKADKSPALVVLHI